MVLPAHHAAPLLDRLATHLPVVGRDEWLARMLAGDVVDAQGQGGARLARWTPLAVAALVLGLWGNRIGTVETDARDPKTSLQEAVAKLGTAVPVYSVEAAGPDHARVFTATVTVGELVTATGTGTSKKHAEMAAALTAWSSLGETN